AIRTASAAATLQFAPDAAYVHILPCKKLEQSLADSFQFSPRARASRRTRASSSSAYPAGLHELSQPADRTFEGVIINGEAFDRHGDRSTIATSNECFCRWIVCGS